MAKFLSSLAVEMVGEDKWRLTKPLVYLSIVAKQTLVVPEGFITDFASVPRIPIIFEVFGDRGQMAAALHDWLYTAPHPLPTRSAADDVLKEALIAQGMDEGEATLMFFGARLGGQSNYEKG